MSKKESRRQVYQKILDRDGSVTTSAYLKAATPKSSPIHDDFEWDDKKAGHAYRLNQAMHYIKRIKVITPGGEEQSVVNVRPVYGSKGEGEYLPIGQVVENPVLYARALDELLKHKAGIERIISEMAELAEGDEQLEKIALARTAFNTAWEIARALH